MLLLWPPLSPVLQQLMTRPLLVRFSDYGEARGFPQNTKCRGTVSDLAGFQKETVYWYGPQNFTLTSGSVEPEQTPYPNKLSMPQLLCIICGRTGSAPGGCQTSQTVTLASRHCMASPGQTWKIQQPLASFWKRGNQLQPYTIRNPAKSMSVSLPSTARICLLSLSLERMFVGLGDRSDYA